VTAPDPDPGRSSVAVTVRGDGLVLSADAWGSPEDATVILLHGGGQTRRSWRRAAQALHRAGRTVLAVDLRGHGASPWADPDKYLLADFAADVREICRSLSDPPILVGASLGGLASLLAVGEADAPIASALILVDVAPRLEQAGAERILDFMRAGAGGFESLEEASEAVSQYLPHRGRRRSAPGLMHNLRRGRDGRLYWHWDPAFLEARHHPEGPASVADYARLAAACANIVIPTLVVRGGISDVMSAESVRDIRSLIPQVEVIDVANAGHMVAGDRNDVFNSVILSFIDRVAPLHAPGMQRPVGDVG
jgi:pimeloyl-ACP methyl ester carboxylesterase